MVFFSSIDSVLGTLSEESESIKSHEIMRKKNMVLRIFLLK